MVSFFLITEEISIFLIHSSVVGHLGCFQNLALVNSGVINIGVSVCKCLYCILAYIPLDIYPGMVSLSHMAVLFLAF
jgi:hypothetical protein